MVLLAIFLVMESALSLAKESLEDKIQRAEFLMREIQSVEARDQVVIEKAAAFDELYEIVQRQAHIVSKID